MILILTIAFNFTNGSEANTKIFEGKIIFCQCKTCGVKVYQHPKSGAFKAVLPTNFHIEQGEVGCLLPDSMKPTSHVNYENRLLDCSDALPKVRLMLKEVLPAIVVERCK
jgi:hypothetical protein